MAQRFDDTHHAHAHDAAVLECEAYNAAFYELGLRWHWDGATFAALQCCADEPAQRLRHYLQTQQPHLLRAYDVDFLVTAIEQRKAVHEAPPMAAGRAAQRRFDWSHSLGRELGA